MIRFDSFLSAHSITGFRTLLCCLFFGVASSPSRLAHSDTRESLSSKSGRFVKLPQLLSYGRSGHSVEVLSDGRLLVAGGAWGELGGENSAEVLRIEDQRVRFSGLKMSTLRSAATHSKLRDGRVLFMGGATDFEMALSSTDIFNPKTNSFSAGPEMVAARSSHASVALPDGRVLVFGGADDYKIHDTVEIFDPERGTFSLVDARLSIPRANHTATLVSESVIAIIGGETSPRDFESESTAPFLNSIELFDARSMQFIPFESNMAAPRIYHTATRLDDQRVLITGGLTDFARGTDVLEILNIAERSVVIVGSSLRARSMHSLTPLRDGAFLIAGGVEGGVPLADSEHCRFIASDDINCLGGPKMVRTRWGHTATPLAGGRIAFIGGLTSTPETPGKSAGPVRGLEIFVP